MFADLVKRFAAEEGKGSPEKIAGGEKLEIQFREGEWSSAVVIICVEELGVVEVVLRWENRIGGLQFVNQGGRGGFSASA